MAITKIDRCLVVFKDGNGFVRYSVELSRHGSDALEHIFRALKARDLVPPGLLDQEFDGDAPVERGVGRE